MPKALAGPSAPKRGLGPWGTHSALQLFEVKDELYAYEQIPLLVFTLMDFCIKVPTAHLSLRPHD